MAADVAQVTTLAVGGFALLLLSFVFILIAYFRHILAHPTNLLFYKTVCDAALAANYLWSGLAMIQGTTEKDCQAFCVLGDVFQKASLFWFVVVIWAVWHALRNPFIVYQEYYFKYKLFVLAAVVGCIVVSRAADISWFCNTNWCMDQIRGNSHGASHLQVALLMLLPVLTIGFVVFAVLVWLRVRRLIRSSGMALSTVKRSNILLQGNIVVTVVGACYALSSAKFVFAELLDAFFQDSDLNQQAGFFYTELAFFLLMVLGDVFALLRTAHVFARVRHMLCPCCPGTFGAMDIAGTGEYSDGDYDDPHHQLQRAATSETARLLGGTGSGLGGKYKSLTVESVGREKGSSSSGRGGGNRQ